MIYDFIDVTNCSSCQNEHIEIPIEELVIPLQIGEEYFTHVFVCPVTQDNVYIKNREDDKYE